VVGLIIGEEIALNVGSLDIEKSSNQKTVIGISHIKAEKYYWRELKQNENTFKYQTYKGD